MRITRHQLFMGIARLAAQRSTCYRLNVGAVLVRDRNVIAIGYNGAMTFAPHCTGNGCQHFQGGACRVVHAEKNVIHRGVYDFVGDDLDLYVTHSPCVGCADLIKGVPAIKRVFFEQAYRDPSGIDRLLDRGPQLYRQQPSGYLIDMSTGELVDAGD